MRAALATLLLAGCAGAFPTPPAPPSYGGEALPRFAIVAASLYRSSQPDELETQGLHARYGIDTVIKLNGHEAAEPWVNGVTVIDEPLYVESTPSPATIDRIMADIDAAIAGHHTVLVHCTHGEDRTGLVIAVWKLRHGFDAADVYGDLLWRGFHPYHGLWRALAREMRWPS